MFPHILTLFLVVLYNYCISIMRDQQTEKEVDDYETTRSH